jgi:hypothetical protein
MQNGTSVTVRFHNPAITRTYGPSGTPRASTGQYKGMSRFRVTTVLD